MTVVASPVPASPTPLAAADAAAQPKVEVQHLNVWFAKNHAVKDTSLKVQPHTVLAVIGPSGCGKSTFLRALNRMHDLVPVARVTGKVLVDGQDLYTREVNPVLRL